MTGLPSSAWLSDVVRSAGAVLLEHFQTDSPVFSKGARDVVTAADHASEVALTGAIRRNFPRQSLWCEDSGLIDGQSPFIWYIDPLDGTKNFIRGNPNFCVSVAFASGNELLLSAIYQPLNDQLYQAEKGCGAFLNGIRLYVSPIDRMTDSLLSTSYPSARRHRDADARLFHESVMATQGWRRTGSSALDLCSVATGHIDCLWDIDLSAWDVAAGVLLIREAKGTVTALTGDPWTPHGESILATNGNLHREVLAFFAPLVSSVGVES